ncbi:putative ubiquitin-conjugating enzyme E2 R521 [Nannochloris sp. 'desiccata']|nr:putative ubiquitin-conjugating enzyme E2 R521 [Chlorella desiccata (nom. nud.)]
MGDQGGPADQMLEADEMDIDNELQVAIMLSMQQEQPPSDQGQISNATDPQETSLQPPRPPQSGAPQSQAAIQAAQLQQALLQAYQQPHPGVIPAQDAPQQAQASAPSGQPRQRAPAPRSSSAPQPAWVKSALVWPQLLPQPHDISIPLSLLDPDSPLNIIFSSALGKSFTSALGPAPPVVTWKWMNSTVSRIPPGQNLILTMQQAWLNAAPVNDGTMSDDNNNILAAPVLSMLRSALALRAVHDLSEDEDDLYFEGGKSMAFFMQSLEGGYLAPTFLDSMAVASSFTGGTTVEHSTTQAREIATVWTGIFKNAFKRVQSLSLSTPAAFEAPLRSLDILTQSAALRECLATILLKEAASGRIAGKLVEDQSIFAPLLRLSALPILNSRRILPLEFPAISCFTELRNYPRNRGSQVESEIHSIRSSLQRVYTAAHEILKRIATLKQLNSSSSTVPTASGGGEASVVGSIMPPTLNRRGGKEVVAAWFAELTASNHHRSEAGSYIDRVLSNRKAVFQSSSDAFLVGATAVALRLCRPFMATAEKRQGALVHLNPRFYTDSAFRVKGVRAERTLAGTLPDISSGSRVGGGGTLFLFPAVSPDGGSSPSSSTSFTSSSSSPPHFVAEMFFATQRLIRVGFVPAIYRYQSLSKMMRRQRSKSSVDDGNGNGDGDNDNLLGNGSENQEASLEEWLLFDSVRAVLADPGIGNDLVQFCELTARWIQQTVLSSSKNATTADGSISTTSLVPESVVRDMCVVLQHFIQQKATELLGGIDIGTLMKCLTGVLRATTTIPSPAVHYSVVQLLVAMLSPQLGTRRSRSGGVSAAEAALISAVLGTGAAQTDLLPALIASYAHADHVVGLDVDKDAYDKFTMRTQIDILLMELWRDPACAKSLDAVATATTPAEKILFSDFCGSVLNDLIYLLKDSLGRLEDIATLERSMGNTTAWEAQNLKEKQNKMTFYRSQQRTVGGFMSMALTTLEMLNTLVASKAVQTGFVAEEIAPRAAGAAFHFIDLLVGPRCAELAVLQNKQQYHFDPDALLLSMLQFTLRLAEQPSFIIALSEHVPDYDRGVLEKTAEVLKDRQLGEYEHRARLEGLVASIDQRRREIQFKDNGAGGGTFVEYRNTNKSDDGDNQGGAVYDEMLASEVASTYASEIEDRYIKALGPLAVREFDSSLPRAYNRHFSAMAETAAGDVSKAAKAISRELRNLKSGKMALPVFAGGALLVRHDGERLDKVRALITGPEGTPYESGCFFFDVFFPPQYPHVPPLMILETTGGGVARFNPNLYSDGKVCLSLLGTWHAGNESEKWNPSTSTLWQVLVSIQSQVLVPEPYYNEPAYEGMKGTVEGDAASLKYNAEIWLNTMRYAMSDVLKHPRVGYEEAIAAHFKTLRPRILKRMAGWVQEAAPLGAVMQKRLEKAAAEVKALLAAL